ncbi:MAG: DUF6058 family natural product biosynthesis protein [Candidatus Thermoplasmatota archaeon]|jgi:predicted DNA-binding transcriptional regulator AlpA|nr:DUF6058 family natural product biosynthesis protein [Candidatus Thermoplasmatota archaeon]
MEEKSIERKPQFSTNDLSHITEKFLERKKLVEKSGTSDHQVEKWIKNGEFPDPTYITPDGKEWFPPYVEILIKRSMENNTNPKIEFLKDADKVLATPGYVYRFGKVETTGTSPEDVENMWMDFKSGLYGACLRKPDPKSILDKGYLIRNIEGLLSKPEPENPQWCSALKEMVYRLDAVEAQFTDYDRTRFGGTVSRDIFITNIKKEYRGIFPE